MFTETTTCRVRPAFLLVILMSLHLVATASGHTMEADGPGLVPPADGLTVATTPVGAAEIMDLQHRVDLLWARLKKMEAVRNRIGEVVERLETQPALASVLAPAPTPAPQVPLAADPPRAAKSAGPETRWFWESVWLGSLRREELQSLGLGLLGVVTLTLASIACVRVGAGIASDPACQASIPTGT
jgi:hypothetical protein